MAGAATPETVEIRSAQGFSEAIGFEREQIEQRARNLIENRADLPNPAVSHGEYRDNARTLLMEALTASAHESVVEIHGQTVEDINAIVLARLVNGWNDSLPKQEKERRFFELCNELYIGDTHQAIADGLLSGDTAVGEVSDYPISLDSAIATSLGYRDKNKKGMVRSTTLRVNEGGTYTRVIQQVSRSNGTPESTIRFFKSEGITLGNGEPDVEALKTPVVYSLYDHPLGATDITRRLDRYSGFGVLYGDVDTEKQNHPGYNKLSEISKQRENAVECYFDGLATLQAQLDGMLWNGSIDTEEHKNIFSEEIDRILSAICVLSPEYAKDTFGEAAATHLNRASELTAAGYIQQAAQELVRADLVKETVIFCGGSISLDRAKELGLEVNKTGELIKKGKETWKKKMAKCRIEKCPSGPGATVCGPCDVCIEKCQPIFDKGSIPVWATTGNTMAKALVSFAAKASANKLKIGSSDTQTSS